LPDLKYQAFVSYSHESDARLATSLQLSLSRFAKPWYRLRTMRIFQDKSSLSANPALWDSIEQALGQAEHFVLLASPASAKSVWVHKEVEWWLQNRSVNKLIVVLTDGLILWDSRAGDFDWQVTTALPSSLKGVFTAEPLYADFRAAKVSEKYANSDPAYRNALLDIAAPLMGRSKDDLDGEDIRLHRKAVLTAWAVAIFIAILGLTTAAGVYVAHQRQETAASRALASEAVSHVDDRSLAMLLSIESRQIADTVESRRALFETIQRVPHAEAFLWGHTQGVPSAVFSPDGQIVLSAGWDNRIMMWSTATHQPIGQPIAAPKDLVSVDFDSDGARFASASSGSIVIWDTKSRQPLGEFLRTGEDFTHVAFSPNGKLIAGRTEPYGGHPSHVYVWDIASHQPIGEPILGFNFAFSPDNSLLAISRYENLILYNLQSHRETKRSFAGHTANISAITFSPDGALIAAGSEDKTILLWDVKSQRALGMLKGHPDTISTLFFAPDEGVLFSGSSDGTIMMWNFDNMMWDVDKMMWNSDALDLSKTTLVKGFGAWISSICLGPDGQMRSLAIDKNRVILLDVNDDPPLGRRISAPDVGSSNVAFSPDGRLLASAGEFGSVLIWDVARGKQIGEPLSGHDQQVSSLAYAPDGKMLVSGSMDGGVIFWDMGSRMALGAPLRAQRRSPVWSLAWSPDSKTVAAAGDAVVVFWDRGTRQQQGPAITSQKERIWALAYSPGGEFLASARNDLLVPIWKIGGQTVLAKTLGTPVAIGSDDWQVMPVGVGFSPDGRLLASSTRNYSVTIWNVKNAQPIPPVLYGHTQAVSSVAFSRDGKLLASGSADGNIRLWDVPTHELLGTLQAQQKAVKGVVFNPRNGILASVGEDNSIIFWNADFDGWIGQACRMANRNLTPQEWSTYIGSRPYRKTCPNL
jgi:WD40 repeat protein